MSDAAESAESLLADYERIAAFGVKQLRDLDVVTSQKDSDSRAGEPHEAHLAGLADGSVQGSISAALGRLIRVRLAARDGEAVILQRPEHCSLPLSASIQATMESLYSLWLLADPLNPDDLLYGELGFWQHWWNLVREAQALGSAPLLMDMVIPDDGAFVGRNWIEGFDPAIRDYVLAGTLVKGRIIVPAAALGSPAEPLLDLALESGFEVRVHSSDARFSLYGGSTVVLSEVSQTEDGRTIELHRATRSRAILEPIERFFDMLWQLAVPWNDFGGETSRILHLLAQGWTDVRIAEEMGISVRTVSRRVSEAMASHGTRSRFELGVRYGRLA